jgi:sulfide:quinone oxidoreductase
VTIAGGGIAGVETALALRDLTGDRVALTIVAPNADLVYRPMTVREPFAFASARRYPLSEIADELGAELVVDELRWVDAEHSTAHTKGDQSLSYDALVIAMGARAIERFPHALTVDDRHMDERLHGLIQDIEGGYVHRVAFVVPARMAWPLPIYELALMTAHRAYEMCIDLKVVIVTPEEAPLAVFGQGASSGISELLRQARIEVITSAYAQVPSSGEVVIQPHDRRLHVERVVALPELYGPSLRGLPLADHGFLPVDPYGAVRGVDRVYAAGDATDFHIKHGGIASQQADVAALSVAALADAAVVLKRFHPVIRGILLTGAEPKYLSARITGGAGFASEISDTPSWSPASKIEAKYLAPYLAERDRLVTAMR